MKRLNLNTDKNLTANSNILAPSQQALKYYIDQKRVLLNYLQATEPTSFSIGEKWLNTSSNKIFTALSSSTWDSGIDLESGQIYSFNNLLYHWNGENLLIYSSGSITETNNNTEVKTWVGTQSEYDAIATKDPTTEYVITDAYSNLDIILATQTEFNNSSTTKAATPYQVNQKMGNYLPLAGGNLNAGAILRLTNTNNEVTPLAFNTSGYLTIGSKIYVNAETNTNTVVVRSGNIYKVNTSGATALWSDALGVANGIASLDANVKIPSAQLPLATVSAPGAVQPDGTTIIISNGVISASGTTISYDSSLSTTSTNAVQNKIVTAAINGKVSTSGDTMTGNLTHSNSTYSVFLDADNDGYGIHSEKYQGTTQLRIYKYGGTDAGTGIYLNGKNGNQPYYYNGQGHAAKLLNTDDVTSVYSSSGTSPVNGTAIASALETVASIPLFYHTFADHLFNDTSWLRADTFSWQSGSMYVSAYQHLVNDFNSGTRTLIKEGAGIWCYISSDGHRIINASDTQQVTNMENLYTATGIAWYYILDTTNQRFKLPRSQYNFVGLRTSVGSYVEESLPNITGTFSVVRRGGSDNPSPTGAFTQTTWNARNGSGGGDDYGGTFTFNASRSSSAYQNDAPVQQRATQMYLYFYCGNTVQNQTAIDVGQITETLNGKADIDLSNVSTTSGFRRLVEVYNNGTSWYKVFNEYNPSTGALIGKWCEQGGRVQTPNHQYGQTTVDLLKTMADKNYSITLGGRNTTMNGNYCFSVGGAVEPTYFVIFDERSTGSNHTNDCYWVVKGYMA